MNSLERFFIATLLVLVTGVLGLACSDDPDAGTDTAVDDVGTDDGDDTGTDTPVGDVGGNDGADGADVSADAEPDFGPGDVFYPNFNLEAATTSSDNFFEYPYPSNRRLTEDGGPDLTTFPTGAAIGRLLDDAVAATMRDVRGFSNVAAVYFTFEGGLDPDDLPATAAESAENDSTVFVVDIDPSSPWYGRRHPVNVEFRGEAGVYWAENTLVMQPLFGFPLRNGCTYAAVVTRAVDSTSGATLGSPDAVQDGLADSDDDYWGPLASALTDMGLLPSDVAVATVFTTSAPAADLWRLRSWMHDNMAAPVATDIFYAENEHAYDTYEGVFNSEEFFEGEAPYTSFGSGAIHIGPDGAPTARNEVELRFALSVPADEMPQAGWPIVLYSHGTGGDYLSFDRHAEDMALRGVAMIGLDQPFHGARNPNGDADTDLIVTLAVTNIVWGREWLRQGTVDNIQAVRLLRSGLTIPADISTTGELIRIDPDRIAFMGHSQGAQIGGILLGVEPDLLGGMLSEGGGGAAISALERKANGVDIEALIGTALGLDADEPLVLSHPATACVIQPLLEAADPLSYARHIFLEPIDGSRPRSFLMSEGLEDLPTPPNGIEALASTAGIPIALPVVRDVEAMQLQGIGTVDLPTSGNLPTVNGVTPTGALVQYEGRGHHVVTRDAGAQYTVFEFLTTLLDGEPEILPGEDR